LGNPTRLTASLSVAFFDLFVVLSSLGRLAVVYGSIETDREVDWNYSDGEVWARSRSICSRRGPWRAERLERWPAARGVTHYIPTAI
jgi:hypothetical protein